MLIPILISCSGNGDKDALELDIQVQELIIKDKRERMTREKEAGMPDSTYKMRVRNLEMELNRLDSLKTELRKYQ